MKKIKDQRKNAIISGTFEYRLLQVRNFRKLTENCYQIQDKNFAVELHNENLRIGEIKKTKVDK